MQATDKIREFITTEILFNEGGATITDKTSLLDGVIDSLALLQVVAYLEEEFGVDIDDGEIVADHFRTVVDIARLVDAKLAVRS